MPKETPLFTAISLDITLANCGIALMDVYGVDDIDVFHVDLVETEKSKIKSVRRNSDDLARSRTIVDKINYYIDEHKVAVVIAEIPVGTQNSRAAMSFGIALGILASLDMPMIEVMPNDVKKKISNSKSVSKNSVIDWAFKKFPNVDWRLRRKLKKGEKVTREMLVAKNEHIADALAVAYAGLDSTEFSRMLKFMKGR